MTDHDAVNSPSHYTAYPGIEVIDLLADALRSVAVEPLYGHGYC